VSDPIYEFRGGNPRTAEYKARLKNGKWLCLKCRKYKLKSGFSTHEKKSTGKRTVRADCRECCRLGNKKRYVPSTPRQDPRRLLPRVKALESGRDVE